MSLITQCPACTTMFRVVPDQLRISEGWVRCGHCDEVFDANAHLKQLDESVIGAPPTTPPSVPPEPEPEQEPVAATEARDPMESPAPEEDFSQPEEDEAYDWNLDLTPPESQTPGNEAPPVAAPDAAQQELDAVAEQLYDHVSATPASPEIDHNAQIEPFWRTARRSCRAPMSLSLFRLNWGRWIAGLMKTGRTALSKLLPTRLCTPRQKKPRCPLCREKRSHRGSGAFSIPKCWLHQVS